MQLPVYLDYHATTPVDRQVLEVMLPFYTHHYGNAASRSHPFGWKASEAVEIARARVAKLLAVDAHSIVFTSGATEGLNLAIKGLADALSTRGKHIITIATEHPAVLDTVDWLSKRGFEVTRISVDEYGHPDIQSMQDVVRKDSIMIIAMWANNETGTIHDVYHIGKICSEHNIAFVCDATQAVGKIEVKPQQYGIDILVFSAHKCYGPKGTGAVYISKNEKKLNPSPLIHGGGHESGFRSGTLNVPGIVGLGAACEMILEHPFADIDRIGTLRDHFEKILKENLEEIEINGSPNARLKTVSNFRAAHVDSQAVMTKLRTKIAISSGSACSSADPAPSHVLLAMGLTRSQAKSSFRVSFGRPTTMEDAEFAAWQLINAIHDHRHVNPVWQMFKLGIDISPPGKEL